MEAIIHIYTHPHLHEPTLTHIPTVSYTHPQSHIHMNTHTYTVSYKQTHLQTYPSMEK